MVQKWVAIPGGIWRRKVIEMFEIEIPKEFIVQECQICGTDHAPIRDCPTVTEEDYDREADYWKWSDRL